MSHFSKAKEIIGQSHIWPEVRPQQHREDSEGTSKCFQMAHDGHKAHLFLFTSQAEPLLDRYQNNYVKQGNLLNTPSMGRNACKVTAKDARICSVQVGIYISMA